jgi:hypothetical protein
MRYRQVRGSPGPSAEIEFLGQRNGRADIHGGHGELVNTARCDRVTTGSIPVGHPNYAGIVQWISLASVAQRRRSRPITARSRFDPSRKYQCAGANAGDSTLA